MARLVHLSAPAIVVAMLGTACLGEDEQSRPNGQGPRYTPGQTDYVTEAPAGAGIAGSTGSGGSGGTGGSSGNPGVIHASAPVHLRRTAPADEGDVLRVDANRLFQLSPVRGFLMYDLADPAQPRQMARLPVAGHPVEMFISGTTVYALLRDVRSLDQVGGVFQYQRRQHSRLVTIDVSDPAHPRIAGTLDIAGYLGDGSTRRVQNTIYTVAWLPAAREPLWWQDPNFEKEQVWVVALDVSNPARPMETGRLSLLEGSSIFEPAIPQGTWRQRSPKGFALTFSGNVLLVVQGWKDGQYGRDPSYIGSDGLPWITCRERQEAIVSVVDIGDPAAPLRERARFQTVGSPAASPAFIAGATADSGTFYGLFSQEIMVTGENDRCTSDFVVRNRLEAWSVGPSGPRKLDALDFGGPRAAVASSAFDLKGKVAYAASGNPGHPLFAFSLTDPADLKLLSETPGLSGELSLFRLVDNGRFLLAVGREPPERCGGQPAGPMMGERPAVTLIDVRDPAAVALVQRRCLDNVAADWLGSALVSDLRQAHWFAEEQVDSDLNLVTLPIPAYRRVEDSRGSSLRVETAVGLMTWDVRNYPERPPAGQQAAAVIDSFPAPLLPTGRVSRSVLFRHQSPGGAPPRRMLLTASDTHLSLVDIEDLRAPRALSNTEVTAHHEQSFRFGEHLVEQVQSRPERAWPARQDETVEFRVRRGSGDRGDGPETPALARIEVARVQRVLAQGENLVLFVNNIPGGTGQPATTDVQVVDLRDPSRPRLAGKLALPVAIYQHWPQARHFAVAAHGLAFLAWGPAGHQKRLLHVDVQDPDTPKLREQELPMRGRQTELGWQPESTDPALVADAVERDGFYLSDRKEDGAITHPSGVKSTLYRYLVQRWQPGDAGWTAGPEINVPGRLLRTWRAADGSRLLLSESGETLPLERTGHQSTTQSRLWLMRQEKLPSGQIVARLLDSHPLVDRQLSSLVLEGDRLMVTARMPAELSASVLDRQQTSDRLLVFDLAGQKLRVVHDQPSHLRGLTLLGSQLGKLVVQAGGDGILAVDLTAPASPRTTGFLPTGDYGGRLEFLGGDAYISAGYLGLLRLGLGAM
jgi:hypothetical protein